MRILSYFYRIKGSSTHKIRVLFLSFQLIKRQGTVEDTLIEQISPKEKKRRAESLRDYICNLPPTTTMILHYEGLVEKLSSMEKLLNKLNAFVRFLSNLNPVKYLEWMHNAFAGFKTSTLSHSEHQGGSKDLGEAPDAPYQTPVYNESPANTKSEKTRRKRFRFF